MPKRYFAALIIIAVVFFGLIGLAINSLTKNNTGDNKKQETSQKQNDIAKDTQSVTYTQEGRLVADENFRAIRISISPDERRIEILQGYDQTVIKSQTLPNKQSAYDAFTIALKNAGFGNYNKDVNNDERGVCPTGKRYIYEAEFKENSTYKSWSATCQNSGSFKGNTGLVRTIFENQIPDFQNFTSGNRLN